MISPSERLQKSSVNTAIKYVKKGKVKDAEKALRPAVKFLMKKKCKKIILGCTELPIAIFAYKSFKKAKDSVADIITPGKKVEIYPGYKRREGAVQTFKAGPYKGLNAIIGYDADPKSRTYTDLTIVAYNPDPNVVFAERVTTIPNYYSLVFAKSKGRRLIDDATAKGFLRQYVEAVLNNDQPKIILLTDFAEALPRIYPELLQPGFREIPPEREFEIPEPSGLNLDPDFRSLGKYSKKDPDPDPLQEKVFKMDPALQRKRDAYMKRLLIKLKKGTYTQLDYINILYFLNLILLYYYDRFLMRNE